MAYHIFLPTPPLRPYIEHYWLMSGYRTQQEVITLLPDTSINLILNLGEEVYSFSFQRQFRHEGIFLVGTMLQWDKQVIRGESRLFGIQFKPGGFTHFYPHGLLAQSGNEVQEFNRRLFPDLKKTVQHFVPYIDQFYLDRLAAPRYSLLEIVADIERQGGQVKITALAKSYYTTVRQLERQFQQQLGISPKEFISLTRFRSALDKIQHNLQQRSLFDIAWDCGYYDHSHLTNDFKRYTGITPTGLILSDFSKTLAAAP